VTHKNNALGTKLKLVTAAFAICAALVASCAQIQDFIFPVPTVPSEWNALLGEVRAFERRIGFKPTENFKDVFAEKGGYSMCGHVPRLYLPYSYQDPAIQWINSETEQECREAAAGNDVFFTSLEAIGEIGTSVTSMMLEAKLDRFLYLVIHEDCHDQFDLPYGVEEALCELITYKAMAAFSIEKYGTKAREGRAVRRYTDAQARLTRATISVYNEATQLYALHARNALSAGALMQERERLYRRAERTLEWRRGALNNVGLSSNMTYSRHYPLLESVHDALGGDLARSVEFFSAVDRAKPARAAVMARLKLKDEKGVQFLRAYESAVVDTIHALLKQRGIVIGTLPLK
jgi:hypothetical protein